MFTHFVWYSALIGIFLSTITPLFDGNVMCADPSSDALQVLYQVLFIVYVSLYTFIIMCPPARLLEVLLQSPFKPRKKRRKRRRKKKRRKSRQYLFARFNRRSLPYHLTLRCYRRKGNRPPRLPSAVSRSAVRLALSLRRKRQKLKRKERQHAKRVEHAVKYDLPRPDSCQAPLLLPRISEEVVSAFVSTLDCHGLQEDHPLNWTMDRVSTFQDPLNSSSMSYHARRVCLLTTSWLCSSMAAEAP